MGEEDKSGGILGKLLDKAGEQGFSFIVMGVCCWAMYSMITQNNADIREEMKDLRDKYEECNAYQRRMTEDMIRELKSKQ